MRLYKITIFLVWKLLVQKEITSACPEKHACPIFSLYVETFYLQVCTLYLNGKLFSLHLQTLYMSSIVQTFSQLVQKLYMHYLYIHIYPLYMDFQSKYLLVQKLDMHVIIPFFYGHYNCMYRLKPLNNNKCWYQFNLFLLQYSSADLVVIM